MRWACRECFFSSQQKLFAYEDQNECIGGKEDWEWNQKQNGGADQNPSLIGQGILTREVKYTRKFTIER